MNKKLIAPIVTAAAMLATSIGSTFALFTSKASSRIDINAGRVAVNYDATVSKALSRYEDLEPWDAIANKTETHAATFENGSTADIRVESTGAVVTLDRLAPMDMIELKVGAENDSNINIKFRYFIKASGDLLPALDLIVDGASLEVPGSSLEFYSAWSSVMTPDVESLFEKNIGIYFPDHGEDDNQYQEKTATLEVGIEAVQGNAEVHDPVDPEPVNEPEEIHSKKPSAANKSVNMESKTGSQSYVVPYEACDESAEELVLTIIPEEEPTAEVPAGKDYLAYDVEITGIKDDNEAPIEARIGIGQGKANVQVFHDGVEIDSNYVEDEGSVYFYATSFSPYDVVFDALPTYGFDKSYIVDEGLETEHWVHEITNISEFRNIVTNEGNTITPDAYYPGYQDYKTVYLVTENIDFGGGAIWGPDDAELIDAFAFSGSLEGINKNIELSRYHLYQGLGNSKIMGLFEYAQHATFKNLVLKDFEFNNPTGENCGFLAGKTLSDNYDADRILAFENILIDNTCSIEALKSVGSLMGLARGCINLTATNVVNNASVTATGSGVNVGGLIAQASTGGSGVPAGNWVFDHCINNGDVSLLNSGANVSGFVGQLVKYVTVTIRDCESNGDLYIAGTSAGYFVNTTTATVKAINFEGSNNVSAMMYTANGAPAATSNKAEPTAMSAQSAAFKEGSRNYSSPNGTMAYTPVKVEFDENNFLKATPSSAVEYDYAVLDVFVGDANIDVATNTSTGEGSMGIYHEQKDSLDFSSLKKITRFGYFAPNAQTEVPKNHVKFYNFEKFFLDYSLRDTIGAGTRYDTNEGFVVVDNTGAVVSYNALLAQPKQGQIQGTVKYSVSLYKDGEVVGGGVTSYFVAESLSI